MSYSAFHKEQENQLALCRAVLCCVFLMRRRCGIFSHVNRKNLSKTLRDLEFLPITTLEIVIFSEILRNLARFFPFEERSCLLQLCYKLSISLIFAAVLALQKVLKWSRKMCLKTGIQSIFAESPKTLISLLDWLFMLSSYCSSYGHIILYQGLR